MGLKSGSRDAGLDDEEEDADQTTERTERNQDTDVEGDSEDPSTETDERSSANQSEPDSDTERPTMDSIPYKLRRNKVNEGREQVPYFLREEVIDGDADLQDTLEDLLGEKVYKSDYREAAMVLAQRNPELIADVLREWGYDLDAT
jgi:hypothetical protein